MCASETALNAWICYRWRGLREHDTRHAGRVPLYAAAAATAQGRAHSAALRARIEELAREVGCVSCLLFREGGLCMVRSLGLGQSGRGVGHLSACRGGGVGHLSACRGPRRDMR